MFFNSDAFAGSEKNNTKLYKTILVFIIFLEKKQILCLQDYECDHTEEIF